MDKNPVGNELIKRSFIRGLDLAPLFNDGLEEMFMEIIRDNFSYEISQVDIIVKKQLEKNITSTKPFTIYTKEDSKFFYVDVEEDLFNVRDINQDLKVAVLNFNVFGTIVKDMLSQLIGNELILVENKLSLSNKLIEEFCSVFKLIYNEVKVRNQLDKLIIFVPDIPFWVVSPSSGQIILALWQDMFNFSDGLIFKAAQRHAIVEKISEVLNVKVEHHVFRDKLNTDIGLINLFIATVGLPDIPKDKLGQWYLDLVQIRELVELLLKTGNPEIKDISETVYNTIMKTYVDFIKDANLNPAELVKIENELKNLRFVKNLIPEGSTEALDKVILEQEEELIKFNNNRPKDLEFGLASFIKFISGSYQIPDNLLAKYQKYFEDKDKDSKQIEEAIKNFDRIYRNNILGQDHVIEPIWNVLKKWYIGIRTNKPVGSFMLCGPTGVGKTETAKVLAKDIGAFNNLIVLDMSEYQSEIDKTKIIGVAPGYQGYDDGPGVLSKVVANPRSVILFDEIEKAHPAIFDLLLQLLDEGRLTDHKGNEVSFKECLIICTTNAHYADIEHLGAHTRAKIIEVLQLSFRKEFLARFNDIIKFNQLDDTTFNNIFERKLEKLLEQIKDSSQGTDCILPEIVLIEDENFYEVKKNIISFMDASLGARELERNIEENITSKIMDDITNWKLQSGVSKGIDNFQDTRTYYFDTNGNLKVQE